MDVPESIMLAVLLICGILQVILFFKIWGMTNNVKRIYSSVADINIVKEIYKHNPDNERLLFDETYNRMLSVYKVESEKTSELFEQTKSKCKMLYEKAVLNFRKYSNLLITNRTGNAISHLKGFSNNLYRQLIFLLQEDLLSPLSIGAGIIIESYHSARRHVS